MSWGKEFKCEACRAFAKEFKNTNEHFVNMNAYKTLVNFNQFFLNLLCDINLIKKKKQGHNFNCARNFQKLIHYNFSIVLFIINANTKFGQILSY